MKKRFHIPISLIIFQFLFVGWMILIDPIYKESDLVSYSGVCVDVSIERYKSSKFAYLTMSDGKIFCIGNKAIDKAVTKEFRKAVENREVIKLRYVKDSLKPYFTVVLETENRTYMSLKDWNRISMQYILVSVGIVLVIDGIILLVDYLQYRANRPKKKAVPNRKRKAYYQKGEAFWYKSKGKIYCAVVLDIEDCGGTRLIALTEAVDKPCTDLESLKTLSVYTLAWFSEYELLNSKRINRIGFFDITQSYNGKAGGLFSAERVVITNYGSSLTWSHRSRNYNLPNLTVGGALSASNMPNSYFEQ